jgi:hypothetical protein
MPQMKEEFHSITLQGASTRVDVEVSIEFEDLRIIKEAEDQYFVTTAIKLDI